MKRLCILVFAMLCSTAAISIAVEPLETDTIQTPAGDLTITFIGHGTLMFSFQEKTLKQGKKKLSRQQFKRAAIEMEMARKLAPGNPTYRQDLPKIVR